MRLSRAWAWPRMIVRKSKKMGMRTRVRICMRNGIRMRTMRDERGGCA